MVPCVMMHVLSTEGSRWHSDLEPVGELMWEV
jgi:hypothetical protein